MTRPAQRQGDVLPDVVSIPVDGEMGVEELPTPDGVVVVSQTCEIVQDQYTHLQVVPLVRQSLSFVQEVVRGRRPRFAHVPGAGGEFVADLGVVASVTKARVAMFDSRPGVETLEEERTLARAVGRKFTRFAFPDVVQACLEPLRKEVPSKYPKLTSPLGQVMRDVYALRVEATGGWEVQPLDLTLVLVLNRGVLPELEDEVPAPAGRELVNWLGTGPTPTAVAERLAAAAADSDVHHLWDAFAHQLADACLQKADRSVVRSIGTDVVPVDEFSWWRAENSESLDLDHFSGPAPLRPPGV